jgi:predicted MFS family arabinose efflux permease
MKGSNIGILAMSMAAPSPDGRFEGHWVLLAMVSCHVSGLFFLPMMPLLFGALAQQFSIDPINLGAIGSLQLSCTAIGAIFLTRLGARYSVRVIVLCAIVGELMINLGCILSDSITTITLLRGVSGLTEGMLLAGASAGAAISRKTEHFFVNYTVALAMLAVTGLSLGAGAIQAYGYAAGFALFVFIDLIGLVLIYRGFPIFMIERNFGNADPISGPNFSTRLVPLFAMGLFGAALAGTQTFIGRLGDLHGGSIQAIGMALSAGWVLAVGTPFFILPLVRRWGGLLVLLGAYVFISMVAVALSITESFPLFLLAASLFTPAALFIEPLQFGVLGSIDPGGRLAAFGPAAISFGSGVGPVLAGAMVAYGGLRAVGVLGSVLLALSLAIFLPAAQKAYRGIAQ